MDDHFDQKLCEEKHKELDEKMKNQMSLLVEINNRLYKDNGNISIQSRINKMENWIKGVCTAFFVLAVPVFLMTIKTLIDMLR